MKKLWNKSSTKQNFAENRGNVIWQTPPENDDRLNRLTWAPTATTNPEIFETQKVADNVARIITAGTFNTPARYNNLPPQVDGFFSESARRFWNIPRQLLIRLFPEAHFVRNMDVLDDLNTIAGNNPVGRYTAMSNALHQYLEPTINYIRHGGDSRNASVFTLDMVDYLSETLESHFKTNFREGGRRGEHTLRTIRGKSWLGRMRHRLNPLNWPNAWQFRTGNRNNARRCRSTIAHFKAKSAEARFRLEGEMEQAYTSVVNHKTGWKNSHNQTELRDFHKFILAVVNNPEGFVQNNGFANPYDFAEIFGTDNRVRVLDTILMHDDLAREAVEAEQANQLSRDMTTNLTNLNTREIHVENQIQTLEDIPTEEFYSELSGEVNNSEQAPSDEEIYRVLWREITRVERRHDNDFDINERIFAGEENKMTFVEKIPYLLKYMTDATNRNRFVNIAGAANFAGLGVEESKKIKQWLHQFREETNTNGCKLSPTEWQNLQVNARDITNEARTALAACTNANFTDSFLAGNQGNIPTQLAPIKSFVTAFDLFDFKKRIESIDESNRGIFADFLTKMTVIRNTLEKMVTEIETAYKAENKRVAQAIPGTNPPVFPARRNLAVSVPLTLNTAVSRLLNTFYDPGNTTSGVMGHAHPGQTGGATAHYDKLRIHLSKNARNSRETQFQTDLMRNSILQWNYWRTASPGRVIPLLQGERADYITGTTYAMSNINAFNDLSIVDNREENELVLQNNDGRQMYILRPEGNENNARLVLYQIDVDHTQHGVNVPKDTVSIDNAQARYHIYSITAGGDLGINANFNRLNQAA